MAGKKQKLQRKKPNFFLILGLIGILCVAIGLSWIVYKRTILSFSGTPSFYTNTILLSGLTHIKIPVADISTDIEETSIVNGVWKIPDTRAAHLFHSALPGQSGNIVIYGHNKSSIFGNLYRVKAGNLIFITLTDATMRAYKIFSNEVVSPKRIDLVSATGTEILTVYTCTGFLDTQRLVIQAKPLKIN